MPRSVQDSRHPVARVLSIDGLRGILAAIVVLAHFAVRLGTEQLLPLASTCVCGFFLISSYALTLSWRGGYATFLGKRFLRLWPAYAVAMMIGAFFTGVPVAWHDYFWFPFKGRYGHFDQDPVVWSLYVEVYASLAMPLIILVSSNAILASFVGAGFVLAGGWDINFSYAPFFLAGSFLARAPFDFAILNSRFVQWLGRISYSLYLTHCLVIMFLESFYPSTWTYVSIPVCLLVAHVFHAVIEQPSISASQRLGKWASASNRAISTTSFDARLTSA